MVPRRCDSGWRRGSPAESVLHEYWKRWYAEKLRSEGYAVHIEAPRPRGVPGRIDVLAARASESVAVEIETGKSDAVGNVKSDLRAGISRIVVVAVDKESLRRVEAQLARADLLGLGKRVERRVAGRKGE